MWALTNVLVGVDPNDYLAKSLAAVYPDLPINTLPWANSEGLFIEQNWLPYKHNECTDFRYSDGSLATCSVIGDWKPEYFDKTANQAYHFWYYVASTFYDGLGLPFIANLLHDPYFLEDECGEDLEKWRESKNPFKSFWARNAIGTTREDYMLSLKGMEYGLLVRASFVSANIIPFEPATWITNNIKR